jgi:superfamily II DNA/RNA helicase
MNFSEIWEKFSSYKALEGIDKPMPVQEAAIPPILEGRDLLIQSPTGTGKTLAYLLPIFAGIKPEIKGAQGVVIAPTYELAAQIAQVAKGTPRQDCQLPGNFAQGGLNPPTA